MNFDKWDDELEEVSEADFRFAQRMRIVAIILFMVISVLLVSCMKKEPEGAADYAFYVKDGEIFYTQLSNIEPKQLTENMSESDNPDEWDRAIFNTAVANDVVIFPDFMKEGSGSVDLYYRELENPDAKNQKLAEKCSIQKLAPKTPVLYYEKEVSDGIELFEWDFEKSALVAENPEHILYAKDGKSIVFLYNKELFLKQTGKEREKLDSDVAYLWFANSDLSRIFYAKNDGSLYQISDGAVQMIAEDTYYILFYEAGDGYYLTKREEPKFIDVLEDDIPAEKSKDALRQEIRETKEDAVDIYDLWYYDGEKSVKLDENFVLWKNSKPQYDLSGYPLPKRSGLIFESYNAENFGKIKLSEVDSLRELEGKIYTHLHETADIYATRKANIRLANEVKGAKVYVDYDGKGIDLYKDPNRENFAADFYRMNFGEEVVEETRFVAEQVMIGSAFSDLEGYDGYMLHGKFEFGDDLYIDGKKVDENVESVYSYSPSAKKDLLYVSDLDRDNFTKTLKLYQDGKVRIIDEHVGEITVFKSALLYLKKEKPSANGETLYYYDGERSHRIDDEVSSIVKLMHFYPFD
ncbi:MAG: hypothetical protein Q4D65_08815 [Peptostreptococcaceae bacterium]|nr:hypothetical protein [Peptostreptococcaceae bacterium]